MFIQLKLSHTFTHTDIHIDFQLSHIIHENYGLH